MQTSEKKPHRVKVAAYQNSCSSHSAHDPLSEVTSRLKGVIKRHNSGMLAFCPNHTMTGKAEALRSV